MANTLLGYPYRLKGLVIKGQGLGNKEFVPTINLDVEEFLIPKEGIYITKTYLHTVAYPSVSFIGHRMSTDGKFAIETHLLSWENFTEIPKNIEIEFYERLRENKKFENFASLKKQIFIDIQQTTNWFKERK